MIQTGRNVKLVLTMALYFCYFADGLTAMLGAARLDIAELIGSDFRGVSFTQSGFLAGSVVGSVFTGWLFSRINRQIGLVLSILIAAATMLVTPLLRSLSLFSVTMVVSGVANAGIDVATNAWLLEIWQEGANPYMQGMHFSYALGQTIAPLIVEPYLSSNHSLTVVPESSTDIALVPNHTMIQTETRIGVPYSISGFIEVLSAAMILLLYYQMPYTDPKRGVSGPKKISDESEINSNLMVDGSTSSAEKGTNEDNGVKLYHIQLITLGCLLLFFYAGLECSTMGFLTEFAVVIDLKLSKSKAAFLSSVMSGAFAINRLVSVAVASKLKPKTMLYVSFAMLTLGNGILLLFANSSELMVWISVAVIGAGHASVTPCIMSFLEERINVTTTVCGLFMVSSFLSGIFVIFAIGIWVEKYPLLYVYINLFGLMICFLTFASLYVIDRRFRRGRCAPVPAHQRRHSASDQS